METRKKRKEIRERHEKELLKYLLQFGTITEAKGRNELHMARVAPRICDLRKKGHNIKTVTNGNRSYYKYVAA